MNARRAFFAILASAMIISGSFGCRLIPTREIQDGGNTNLRRPDEFRNRNLNRPENRSARPIGRSPNTPRTGGDARSKGPGFDRSLEPPLPGANLGNLFFLLPSPFSGTSRGAEMLDLFSAPLMDRRSIIAAAGKLEERSRGILAERRSRACAFFRSAPQPKQRALLGYWRAAARSQLNAWEVSASRLDAGVDLHLKRARKSGSLLGDPSRSLKLVRRLRLERQQLIVRWWEGLFRVLPGPKNPCSDPSGKKGKKPGTVGVPTKTGPEERLFEPLALARYEFLRRLPAEFRLRLILTFHSPRNSDK